jgi:hypothetical protein
MFSGCFERRNIPSERNELLGFIVHAQDNKLNKLHLAIRANLFVSDKCATCRHGGSRSTPGAAGFILYLKLIPPTKSL